MDAKVINENGIGPFKKITRKYRLKKKIAHNIFAE
jgi:hypothetical protein